MSGDFMHPKIHERWVFLVDGKPMKLSPLLQKMIEDKFSKGKSNYTIIYKTEKDERKLSLDENAIYSEAEVREALEMSTEELLRTGKFVRLYDWRPSLKLYEKKPIIWDDIGVWMGPNISRADIWEGEGLTKWERAQVWFYEVS